MSGPFFMKLGMYIVATDRLNGVLHKSLYQSVYLYVYAGLNASILSALGNGSVNIFPLYGMRVTLEETLEVAFSMRSVSY
jgi:hypothetical protein